MNVLALVTDAFGGFGGIAQYNRDLSTALVQCQAGGRVVVLPRHANAPGFTLPAGVRQLEPNPGRVSYTVSAFRAAKMEGPFHAVFCGHLHIAPLGAIVARLLGVPLWLQLHGVEAWGPISRMQRWAAEQASLVTAVSRYTRHRFLALSNLAPARLRVLPNTVQPGFAAGPKPDYLIERHHLHGKKVLLTVGRLAGDERGKGHDKVMQAVSRLTRHRADLVYVIAGTGSDRPRMETLARRLGIEHQVLFVGLVEARELPDYYRLADVFIMPSIQEGFGIVFLEAAASGLTLIGGNGDGSIDALAEGTIGFTVDTNDPDELVSTIAKALSGNRREPDQVQRFKFANFARCVADLTSAHLLSRQGDPCGDELLCRDSPTTTPAQDCIE
jgi:phosphatidylinositol alpha-1,6-mannosyltransferase